ncbi:MAG: hypothetical protein P8M16_11100 [Acidimicrobiales bacterium]|nr:hypothetical protein [Acidimicrobiales bacterium]
MPPLSALRLSNLHLFLYPATRRLHRAGLNADIVTASGLLLNIGAAVSVGVGYPLIGFAFVALTLVVYALDGPIVVMQGGFLPLPRESLFRLITGRLSDAILMGGVAWHANSHASEFPVLLPMGVLALVSIASYTRSRAEVLGIDLCKGLMERTQRTLTLCLGLLIPDLLEATLWVILALTFATAGQHFVQLWKKASDAELTPYERRSARRHRLHEDQRSSRENRTHARRVRSKVASRDR